MTGSSQEKSTGGISYYLRDFWTEIGDPRSGELPFMGSFTLPLTIFGAYLLFALYLGPKLMERRRPFSLKAIIIPYNLTMSLLNLVFFVKVLHISGYGRRLLEVDWKERDDWSEEAMSNLKWAWLCLLSKYVDLLDTLFFILRKKQSQVTGKSSKTFLRYIFKILNFDLFLGLHIYHHSMVSLLGWVYLRTNALHVTAATFALLNTPVSYTNVIKLVLTRILSPNQLLLC